MSQDCIFCKIINKEIPSSFVYEDENVVAIKDIRPLYETHILFLTKKHIDSIDNLDDESQILNQLFKASKVYSRDNGLVEKGYRNMINCGPGFQEVMHIHLHLLSGKRL